MSYFYGGWAPYVPVAERRREAQRQLSALKKQGRSVAPVTIQGHTIAKNFWGRSWCSNLEHYSDFATRLPRGRSYVRNGAVVDLQVAKGKVTALVVGSELYTVDIAMKPVAAKRWKAICRDCAGGIDSVIELLQGRLADGVTKRICRTGDGLFPAPSEITLSCSCPDWADMCKHVAAVLYGVGAKLDKDPNLLFVLRGVNENDLLTRAGEDLATAGAPPRAANVLPESDLAALFGLEMASGDADSTGRSAATAARKPEGGKRSAAPRNGPSTRAGSRAEPADSAAAKKRRSPGRAADGVKRLRKTK